MNQAKVKGLLKKMQSIIVDANVGRQDPCQQWIEYCLEKIKNNTLEKQDILSVYGGAGSLNDFVMGLDYQLNENQRLMRRL